MQIWIFEEVRKLIHEHFEMTHRPFLLNIKALRPPDIGGENDRVGERRFRIAEQPARLVIDPVAELLDGFDRRAEPYRSEGVGNRKGLECDIFIHMFSDISLDGGACGYGLGRGQVSLSRFLFYLLTNH